MTVQKQSWIRLGIQAVIVSIVTSLGLNATDRVVSRMDKLNAKIDKIETLETRTAILQQQHSEDSIFRVRQILMNADLQTWDYKQDQALTKLESRVEKNEDKLDFALKYKSKN